MHNVYFLDIFLFLSLPLIKKQNKKTTQTFLHHPCLSITVSPTYSNLNIYNDSFTTNGSAH